MIELNVPFLEKDEAKQLGARWNARTKRWYIPQGASPEVFARWLPDDYDLEFSEDKTEYTLSAFLFKISDVINANFRNSEWVSAEISELRNVRGNVYLTLVEHDQDGNQIASIRATIWKKVVDSLFEKFKTGTGSELTADLKVRLLVEVSYNPQYGISLNVVDIDPAYTMGDMAAKVAKIREFLINEKIYDQNKKITAPKDFFNVAIISPQNAAGLGDFNREAQLLEKYSLCKFEYFTALFQGENAPKEILNALDQAIEKHSKNNFDAIVIIRGGGALADLAWLNDEELARAVCLCPVHVMVGVGHERDFTILDEIAGERFDTPSKVSHRIFNLITSNAMEAEESYERVKFAADNVLSKYLIHLDNFLDQIKNNAKQICVNLEQHLESLISEILIQNPQNILKKGFALVRSKNKIITSKQTASKYQKLEIEFHDGKIETRI